MFIISTKQNIMINCEVINNTTRMGNLATIWCLSDQKLLRSLCNMYSNKETHGNKTCNIL